MRTSQGPGSTPTSAESAVFPNGGEMGRLCRMVDWAATPLGPVDAWPESLRTIAATVLGSGFPMILVWGPELIQIYNDAYAPLIGQKHPAALAMPTHDCWPEIRHLQEPVFERVFSGETVNLVEAHYPLTRNGFLEDCYFDATFVPVPIGPGEIGGSVSTLFEVTSRVTARVLEAEREKFRLVVEHSNDAHALFDSEARLLWANRLMSERLGYTLQELQTLAIPDFNPEFSLARYKEIFERARRERVPPFESVHRRKDGTTVPVEITATVVEVAEGARMSAAVRDITERKQIEASLRESEARFRVLADLSPSAMLVIADGSYAYANRAAVRLLGVQDVQELLGRSPFDFTDPDHHATMRERGGVLARAGTVPVIESRVRRRDGSSAEVEVAAGAITWRGKPAVQVVLHDITERKRVEKDLVDARQVAERASQAKSQFLAVMSHELRTPLTGVIGFADLLETEVLGPIAPKQQEALSRIKASSWHLVSIIDEILTLSRAEAGKEEVRWETTDLSEIAREVVEIIKSQADARGLILRLEDAEAPLPARTDPGKVRQMLINLVGNAVKYTQEGEISVRVDDSAPEWLQVHVRDTGPGIAPEDQERIFKEFEQLDSSHTRAGSGTGLGLAICRRLARLLGGEVLLQSAQGEGSTFTLRLPQQPQEAS